jgi:hypothetical protein
MRSFRLCEGRQRNSVPQLQKALSEKVPVVGNLTAMIAVVLDPGWHDGVARPE